MNIVIYARFSSHAQNEQSIEGQLLECYEFAKRNNYTVIQEYIDRAISGTTADKRPAFLEMIEDSKKQQFQGVLVYQLDRFARNRYDSATYKAKLKKNDVRVFSARENIADDASGILIEGVLESMAEYYSAELSQKVKRGIKMSANKGLYCGGGVALGYKIDENKRYIVDVETAKIVKTIFEMYRNEHTVTEITTHLNNLGYKTIKGGAFNKNSLHTLLRNKKYIGIYELCGVTKTGVIPSIIDDDLFNDVQRILERNKKNRSRTRAKEEYILTTKVFCGHCREIMRGCSGTSRTGKIHHYYACNGKIKKVCKKKNVSKNFLEDLVINECKKQLTTENINKIANEVFKFYKKQENPALDRYKKMLKENERKSQNLMSSILECDNDTIRKALTEQIPILENEKKELETNIAKEQLGQVHISSSDIKFFLKQLKTGDVNDIRYRKLLVNTLVNAVYIFDDEDNSGNSLRISLILNTTASPITVTKSTLEEIEYASSFDNKDCTPVGNTDKYYSS